LRLFAAIDLPAEVKETLESATAALWAALPRARRVRRAAFHVTLAFLGETEDGLVPAVARVLRAQLEQEFGFRARLAGVGAFPYSGRVRTVWVGLEPEARWARLAELVRSGLAGAGIPFDAKPFRPHVTLARCDPPWPAQRRAELATLAAACAEPLSAAALVCERVTLFSSALGKGGPTHTAEAEVALRSAEKASLLP